MFFNPASNQLSSIPMMLAHDLEALPPLGKPMLRQKHINDACIQIIQYFSRDSITLYDGSEWKLHHSKVYNRKAWIERKIVIIQTDQHNVYTLFKLDDDAETQASLVTRPYQRSFYFNLFEKKINVIDSAFEVVEIKDDTVALNYLDPLIEFPKPKNFIVLEESQEELKRWKLGEAIVMGLQYAPTHTNYQKSDFILINCTLKTHLKVIEFM